MSTNSKQTESQRSMASALIGAAFLMATSAIGPGFFNSVSRIHGTVRGGQLRFVI